MKKLINQKNIRILLNIIMATLSAICILNLIQINLLPNKYLYIVLGGIVLFNLIIILLPILFKKKWLNIISIIISILSIILFGFIINVGISNIYSFLNNINITTEVRKPVEITSKPFILYISGIDQYDNSDKLHRSDVNQIIVINPNTKKVLMLNTQRDVLVKLHGVDGLRDKLNQAGIYGIDMSVKTLEDFYDIDINYYIKVNFNTLIDLVDAIGKIEVNNDLSFTGNRGTYFKKGMITLNGVEALEYARERKHLPNGDTGRGYHQQLVLEAILNKIISTDLIFNYNEILKSFKGKLETNLNNKEITSLVKFQLDKNPNWNITHFNVNGKKIWYDYTYTLPDIKDYVMEADANLIEEAKIKINEIMEEK